jgi:gamma-glutamyltranspeptidase / glutathione hydrolase
MRRPGRRRRPTLPPALLAILLVLLACGLSAVAARAQLAPPAAQRHMLVASHPAAAAAGLEILRAGGRAVDAAVAVQAVLSLVEPQSSGIGGGAFLLHWDAARAVLSAWDGRETAPAAAAPGLFLRDGGQPMGFLEAAVGGRAVGVPGAIRMLEAAHRQGGRLPWAQLFAPAIQLAEEGFEVSPRLAGMVAADAERLRQDPGARALFFLPDGQPVPAGHRLRNPALAATLRAIAEGGADALHRGPIAADVAAAVRRHPNPGLMTTDDLAGYRPIRREAVCGVYRAVTVCGFPPPSSGGIAVLQILGVLGHQDMAALAPRTGGVVAPERLALDAAHLLGEAGRIAFADRNRYLADPAQVPVPSRGLLDPVYLTVRAQLLDRERAIVPPPRAGNPPWRLGPPPAAHPPQPEHGTAHLSIADASGDVVAMTTTIEANFGSRLMVRGFLLNNELTDFSFLPEVGGWPVANRVGPAKRPRSSMAPTIVFGAGGEPVLALGSAGGSRMIGHLAQTLVALIDWGLEPQEAVALPRVGALDGSLELEAGTAAAALAPALEARGFPVRVGPNTSGLGVIRIERTPEGRRLAGGADPRREGVVLGE